MTEYAPNKWVVIEIHGWKDEPEKYPRFKVFGSWSGGYLDGDSWRMNSGVESVSEEEDHFLFHGISGSTYYCHKLGYGTNAYTSGVLQEFLEYVPVQITLVPEETDWLNLLESDG